jgi:hypothetical protein
MRRRIGRVSQTVGGLVSQISANRKGNREGGRESASRGRYDRVPA